MCLQLSSHVFAHLKAVFNQLAHKCGHLTVSALELLYYFESVCVSVCVCVYVRACVRACVRDIRQ